MYNVYVWISILVSIGFYFTLGFLQFHPFVIFQVNMSPYVIFVLINMELVLIMIENSRIALSNYVFMNMFLLISVFYKHVLIHSLI